MSVSAKISNVFIEFSCMLFILLFSYASVSKLLDFETFETQLGQSPLLSAYAGTVSVGIIVIELLASSLLIFQKTRLIGLYLSFFLMMIFTTYIIVILNFSPYIPCSCGGVLQELSWQNHLFFNGAFIILIITSLLLNYRHQLFIAINRRSRKPV